MYDLLIKNGNIADGSGKPCYVSDIAVKEGKIVALGKDLTGETGRIIDANGLAVVEEDRFTGMHAGKVLRKE